MRILGIETSCDETAIALIATNGVRIRVLAHLVASQAKLHAKYGGIVPNLAKGEHQKALIPLTLEALHKITTAQRRRAVPIRVDQELRALLAREPVLRAAVYRHLFDVVPPRIDAIAVTIGPGLAPALWVGVNFARALSLLWGKPLIPVNHLEGHIMTNVLPRIPERSAAEVKISQIDFPALCLVVSGGHTELVSIPRFGMYRVIGETLDDAAGEAFDKVAKMMGLGFPGGPVISKLAERGNASAFPFPRPMLETRDFNFSFSGLKTAVLYTIRDAGRIHLKIKMKQDISASFQRAVVDVLVAKTVRAARAIRAKTVMIGGGVAANQLLRDELGRALRMKHAGATYLMPNPTLTGDNALMIALAGYLNRKRRSAWRRLHADPNLRLDDATSSPFRQRV